MSNNNSSNPYANEAGGDQHRQASSGNPYFNASSQNNDSQSSLSQSNHPITDPTFISHPDPLATHQDNRVLSPFSDQYRSQDYSSQSLQPVESYYESSSNGLPADDPYNADFEEDAVPLTDYPNGSKNGYARPSDSSKHAPYPPQEEDRQGGAVGLFRRITQRRNNTHRKVSGSPYVNSYNDSATEVDDMPIEYIQGLPGVDGEQPYGEGQNAYFPYPMPYNPGDREGPIPMPDPYRPESVTTDLIDASWEMRQQQLVNENYAKRQVNLVNGIFSTEYPVPSAVRACVEPKHMDLEGGSTEFTHMRYTAATVDPDDFDEDHGYTLRAKEYNRETELLIAVTYYSEDKVLTARTLYGIMKNVHNLCADRKSSFWHNGSPPWQKIVVTIIMDGIEPCRKDVLDTLATMGIYQDGVMKKSINENKTTAHIFEYTSQICVSPELELLRPTGDAKNTIPPIQYILCLKQENSKKINSHRWLFNGFGRILNPNICILVDAGTKPASKSLVHLWRAFYNNQKLGGACGEIHAMLGKHMRSIVNPLVAAQNFEYKISNILDKPLESTFGFISVLPGAFSAYRYQALLGRPLDQYFLGDHSLADRLGDRGLHGMSIFRRNMFLAEDRILCFEITFKRNEAWHLEYVKASKAETDVPEQIDEFISQRRRWLNGSFAATLYSMMHFGNIYTTSHNPLRTIFLHLQLLYNFTNLLLTWFSLAAFYLTTTVIMELAGNPNPEGMDSSDSAYVTPFPFPNASVSTAIAQILRFLYIMFLIVSFFLSLGNRPKGSRKQFTFLFVVYGLMQTYALIIAIYLAVRAFQSTGNNMNPFQGSGDGITGLFQSSGFLVVLALASTYGLFIISGILYLDIGHLVTSLAQYTFIMPSFTNVVNVYAFCNWHDVSWGTKGSDKADALPAANSTKADDGKGDVIVEFERPQQDLDSQFNLVVQRALKPYPKEDKSVKVKRETEDENKSFRTNLIIFWFFCNAILILILTSKSITEIGFSGTTNRTKYYFFALIILTAIMAFIRLMGCIIFVTKSYFKRGFGKR